MPRPKNQKLPDETVRILNGDQAEELINNDAEEVRSIEQNRGPTFEILETLRVEKDGEVAVINAIDVEKWKAKGWSPKN